MNALKTETSPYLLQHADNPVEWYPWGAEALELARQQNKPILLSIGYSACHWCHVMAHESFEDPATAALMNERFVNIKVDREERPDLDKIYQSAHQLIQRRPGGWPLTVMLSPVDQRPFFAGTYFPNEPRHGMPSFTQLLAKAADHYRDNHEEIAEYGESVVNALAHIDEAQPANNDVMQGTVLAGARAALEQSFDAEQGGFGAAPKFPHPTNIERLLRHWRNSAQDSKPDTQAMYICALTLTRMAEGGIYDQIGGGFCRYAVDGEWAIPHFEKMLYDNAALLALYAQFWQVSGDDAYRQVALDTAAWVLREMRDPEGGFYAALDADSEGEEGLFYVWTPDEVTALLTADEYAAFAPRFGLDREPSFEGRWHLRVSEPVESIASNTGKNISAIERLINDARVKLLATRDKRVRPGLDDKIITSWNAMMIRGLAITARSLQEPELATSATEAIDFIREKLVIDDQLYATYKDGQAKYDGYLDDYAFLLDATIELLQARWNSEHLQFAIWLADKLLANFSDEQNGGFFFTANDHEQLIHRSKTLSDEALPSGNSVAALALNRLGHILGETRYIEAALNTVQSAGSALEDYPHAHTSLVTALDEMLQPTEIVIVRGELEEAAYWAAAISAIYTPRRLVFAISSDETHLPESIALRKAQGDTVAYICKGTSCTQPLTTLEAIAAELS
ncbi:MAG: thioredoxin domain-containing protein [Gammaproteobacteria bacterium]|nr:thioredoxin domain-containing protein [Gammaproteobacteria bacterium]